MENSKLSKSFIASLFAALFIASFCNVLIIVDLANSQVTIFKMLWNALLMAAVLLSVFNIYRHIKAKHGKAN